MKLLIALLAAAGLSGCVGYGVPYGADVYYGSGSPYYGGGAYYGTAPYYGGGYYGGTYSGGTPYVVEQRPTYIYGGSTYSRPSRDQDRDGVPNRYDRDRDGDGVPNRLDAYPGDPRRR